VRLFKIGYVVFVFATLLAGFAQPDNTGYDLIAYRVVMGLGATGNIAMAQLSLPFFRLSLVDVCSRSVVQQFDVCASGSGEHCGKPLDENSSNCCLQQFIPFGQFGLAQGFYQLSFASGVGENLLYLLLLCYIGFCFVYHISCIIPCLFGLSSDFLCRCFVFEFFCWQCLDLWLVECWLTLIGDGSSGSM